MVCFQLRDHVMWVKPGKVPCLLWSMFLLNLRTLQHCYHPTNSIWKKDVEQRNQQKTLFALRSMGRSLKFLSFVAQSETGGDCNT